MAGKRHHHIWRMLQRGFGVERGADYHIWVYRRGEVPREKGTGNFGVEKYFYGEEGSETDRAITDFEQFIQGDIQSWRALPSGSELDSDIVALLISHLEIRSSFLRAEVSGLLERTFSALDEHFGSTERVKAMLRTYLESHPEKLDEFLSKKFVLPKDRAQSRALWDTYLENIPAEDVKENFGKLTSSTLGGEGKISDIIKTAHNNSILEISHDSPRTNSLRKYRYNLYRPKDGEFILPDTCCAFFGENSVGPVSQKNDGMHTVVVPISSDVAVIGRKGHENVLRLSTLNRILAGCAYDAFIASANRVTYSSLARRIGKHAKLISDQDIREIFSFEYLLSSVESWN